MTDQEAALVAIAETLEYLGIPYMVIGGMANAVWGEPRATLDIDITVWVEEHRLADVSTSLSVHFRILPENPVEFIQQTRVLPVETKQSVRIDVIFGMLPFEQEAIERSVSRIVAGKSVQFCTAEDLILHKIISDREQDLRDVRSILHRMGAHLDRSYLDSRIEELAEALERPDILSNYESWLHRT